MYISNLTHFLDETGNIPKHTPKVARELASFHVLVVDATTKEYPAHEFLTEIRCFEKDCDGKIKTQLRDKNDYIYWECSVCPNEGRIGDWQHSKWDNIIHIKETQIT